MLFNCVSRKLFCLAKNTRVRDNLIIDVECIVTVFYLLCTFHGLCAVYKCNNYEQKIIIYSYAVILDQSDRVGATSSIFALFALVAPQPLHLCENCEGQRCKA